MSLFFSCFFSSIVFDGFGTSVAYLFSYLLDETKFGKLIAAVKPTLIAQLKYLCPSSVPPTY